jgi:DNA-binding transcriptional LysR family regulator
MAVPAQLAALRSQTLDLGFVRPPISDPDLDSALLTRESLIVALPARHRLAHRAQIPLAALAREPFVLVPRDLVPVYHDIVLKACREAGFVPHSPYEADHLLMVLEMVSGGSGVALVPAFARSVKPPRVTFASLRPPAATLEMSMAWRRDDPAPLLAGFVKIAAKVVPRRP